MASSKRLLFAIGIGMSIGMSGLHALQLPHGEVALNSTEGQRMLMEAFGAGTAASFGNLVQQLVTQDTQTFCSVASSATVLNALAPVGVIAPVSGIYDPFPYHTQETVLSGPCVAGVPSHSGDPFGYGFVATRGAVLYEVENYLGCWAEATRTHADQSSVEAFRAAVSSVSSGVRSGLIANFDRGVLGENGGGHYSPIGGYHAESDMVLLFDVARYKYPLRWIAVAELFDAMNTVDDAVNQSRGWISVQPSDRIDDRARAKPTDSVLMEEPSLQKQMCIKKGAAGEDPNGWLLVMACMRDVELLYSRRESPVVSFATLPTALGPSGLSLCVGSAAGGALATLMIVRALHFRERFVRRSDATVRLLDVV